MENKQKSYNSNFKASSNKNYNEGSFRQGKITNDAFKINDCDQRPMSSSSRIFNPSKTSTINFFKDAKVESCSHIIEHKGTTFAVPYTITNSKGRPLSAYKYVANKSSETKSIYRKDYSVKQIMYCGMKKKPLIPYDPLSYRNRLATTDYYIPYKNVSKLGLGEQADVNKKQWLSTNKDSYQWPVKTPVTNMGILSDTFKKHHKKLVAYI